MELPEEVILRDAGKKVRMIEEVWREHKNLSKMLGMKCEVSNLGLVRRERKTGGGYMYYTQSLRNKGSGKKGRVWFVTIKDIPMKVHQLVWEAFYGQMDVPWYRSDVVIDHINGISLDNRLVNLQLLPALLNSQKQDRDDSKGLF